jgi:alpha-galactosidase
VGVFRLSGPGSAPPEVVVKLRGADIAKRYRVRFDNSGSETELSGYRLVKEGVPVRLEGALTSELVLFTAK